MTIIQNMVRQYTIIITAIYISQVKKTRNNT